MKKLFTFFLAVAIALLILIATSFFALLIDSVDSFILRGIFNTLSFVGFCVVLHKKGFPTWYYLSAGVIGYVIFSLILGTFYTGAHPGYKMIFFAPWVGLFFGWLFNNAQKIRSHWKIVFLCIYFFLHYAVLFDRGVHAIAYSPMINSAESTYRQDFEIGLLPSFDTLYVRDLKHEINLFHFWNSACGSCKMEMELYPAIIEELNGRVMIYPANSEMPNDTLGLFYSLSEFENSNCIKPIKGFGVKESPLIKTALFPSTVVLDKNGNIVFIGNLENALEKFQ
jgi:thiol-disulfide isomerase/thioredoxin